jgi:hypothetical protein
VCTCVRIRLTVFLSLLTHFILILFFAIFYLSTSLFDNHVYQYNYIPNLSCVYLRVRAVRWRAGRRIRRKARTGLYWKQGTYVLCTACPYRTDMPTILNFFYSLFFLFIFLLLVPSLLFSVLSFCFFFSFPFFKLFSLLFSLYLSLLSWFSFS